MFLLEETKRLVSTKKVSDNLIIKTYESLDKYNLMLEINYKIKFVIEKTFTNTVNGREEMDKALKELNTEDKVKQYFGIK